MKDKRLTIHSAKPLSPKEGNTIRAVIPDDVLEELHGISDKTGIAISQIARMCIEFALPFVEVIE